MTCSVCEDFGWLSQGPNKPLVECTACNLIARRRAETEEKRRADRATKYLGELRAALGRLSECTFDSFDAARALTDLTWNETAYSIAAQRRMLKDAVVKARVFSAGQSGWLYLYGPTGGGKSHLTAAIANDCAKNGMPTAYASTPELLAFVQKGFKDNSSDVRFEGLQGVELLVLDDLGTEKASEWTVETLFRLLDERSRHSRPTVLTSNLHYDALPPRLSSRIAEIATVSPLIVSDYRRLPR